MTLIEEVLADARAYTKSRAILTAVDLDIFTRLRRRPAAAVDLAAECGCDPRSTRRLLDALAALGLLTSKEGRYSVTEAGALLSSDHPDSIRDMVAHQIRLWRQWSRLTEAVRLGRAPDLETVHEEGGRSLEAFIGAMHVVGRRLAPEIAASCDPARFSRLLDIGGASGTYTIAFLRANPRMTATLFDHPDVIPLAERRLREEGLLDRVTLAGGDFYVDELPSGCDAALVSAIIHQNGPAQNVHLYRKIHRALPPGGVVLIRDHVMEEDRSRPALGALFALNMLVTTPEGDTYTLAEISDQLRQAGFTGVRLIRSGERMDAVVEARR